MSELTTTHPINVAQLGHDHPEIPFRIAGPEPDGTYKVSSDCSQNDLESFIASHVADSNWTPPAKPPTAEETAKKAKQDALRAKLKLTPEELATLKEMLR